MKLIENSPDIALAKAKRDETKSDLDQAQLNLQYCDVVAEIDGQITRRNVNPGNNVQAGEGLMALRSLTDIWIDANFKETQLRQLQIGQRADLEVDMYGSHQTFHGKITGFTMGTGSTLALLPPENATGNFIKVVQRLPVRIDLVDYDPDKGPLFVGLSVVPYVFYKEPGAGRKLQDVMTDLQNINPDKLRTAPPVPAAAEPFPTTPEHSPAQQPRLPNGPKMTPGDPPRRVP
jgi:membrane fusion protein, multidrug efflux system